MRKGIFIFFIGMVLAACSHAPYHVELDPLSRKQTVPKYGEGTHYFIYTRHSFASNEDSESLEIYFQDIGYLSKHLTSDCDPKSTL
jgi:hypothetical protein